MYLNPPNTINLQYAWLMLMLFAYISSFNITLWSIYAQYVVYAEIFFCMVYLFFYKLKLNFILFIVTYFAYLLFLFCFNDKCGIRSVIYTIVSIIMLESISQIKFDKKIVKFLDKMSTSILVLLSIHCLMSEYKNYLIINTNILGFFVMFTIMSHFCFKERKCVSRIDIFWMLLAMCTLLSLRARGSLFATLCFLLMCYCYRAFTARRTILFILFTIVAGTIFPLLYVEFVKNTPDITILGKSIASGRQVIWSNVFEEFIHASAFAPLFGLGSRTKVWAQPGNSVHNYYLTLILNFGVIGYIMYCSYFMSIIKKIIRYFSNWRVQRALFMFVASVLILGFSEASGFWPPLLVFSYIGLSVGYSEYRHNIIHKG